MRKTRQPVIVATILFFATLTLVGASVAAATLPSSGVFWDRTHPDSSVRTAEVLPQAAASSSASPSAEPAPSTPSTAPTTPAVPAASAAPAPSVTSSPSPAATETQAATEDSQAKPITYTVKSGDTLSDIAAWFKEHGYQKLYERNKKIIGSNPDLIFPGQRITISNGEMTMDGKK